MRLPNSYAVQVSAVKAGKQIFYSEKSRAAGSEERDRRDLA